MDRLNTKKKVAVFISGRGSNLKSLIKHSKKINSKYKIELVLSNKKSAKGLFYAKKNKIKNFVIEGKLQLFEKKSLNLLKKYKIKILCLAGFMRVLSKNFLSKTKISVINIHPSLLPKLKGLNTHERAIKLKHRYSGCSVHFVNEKLDSGKIILQKKVKILKKDTPKSLAKKILKLEHVAYSEALNLII
jgi:phosphoribosylglycinamide formyltransferase-1